MDIGLPQAPNHVARGFDARNLVLQDTTFDM
jgi:hypothetical protein